MAEQLTNYQCMNCNGPLRFDPKKQKLVCDNCGNTYSIEEITAAFEEKNEEAVSIDDASAQASASETLQWSNEEAQHLRAYNCPSCGAQLVTDDTTAATSCPYCGNPTVVPNQFTESYRPDYIIPFRHQKDEAIQTLTNFYKGKPFLPSQFKEQNHIVEIKGVYVPFWLFDSNTRANLQYRGTRVHSHTRGDEHITITEYYQVGRQGTVKFNKVPTDASKAMPDELMDAIEPFNYDDLQPFNMSYLPGFLANRYDVEVDDEVDRVNTRMKNSTISVLNETIVGYSSLIPQQENVTIKPGTVHYAFFPVWLLSTQYGGKNYLFAMNGQTGKMVSDKLPTNWGKFFLTFIGIMLVVSALAYFILNMKI